MPRLSNKIAIVTGAASGIGLGIANLFVNEGAKVVFSDINKSSGKEKVDGVIAASANSDYKNNVLFVDCDVSNKESVKSLIAKTTESFGSIDILVNNAGIVYQKPISQTNDEEWNTTINVNLKGPFLLTREVLPVFEKNGKGKIVNIAYLLLALLAMKIFQYTVYQKVELLQ